MSSAQGALPPLCRPDGGHLTPVGRNDGVARLSGECALLEAVKRSPLGARSNPIAGMFEASPRFLLRPEINILKPAVVLVLGRSNRSNNRNAVRPVLRPTCGSHTSHFERDTLSQAGFDGGPVPWFCPRGTGAFWHAKSEEVSTGVDRAGRPPGA